MCLGTPDPGEGAGESSEVLGVGGRSVQEIQRLQRGSTVSLVREDKYPL